MPYIKQEQRKDLEAQARDLGASCDDAGELNFVITCVVSQWLMSQNWPIGYLCLSAARGVLHDVHDELYRRVVGEYEDRKIMQNGDVAILKACRLVAQGLVPSEEEEGAKP